ncbi:MAG TPA: glycosyltransferase, partial [Candidatus Eisenbacteria bacterium]|nr:glycosyltransferase [Candidatus Eisenbacteria bacterium]
ILKPLKGCDTETEACLRTWLEQDYPGAVQILFGVASEDDPAVDLVRNRLKSDVIVCPEALGPNAKVSTLAQLEPLIQHELVIISDADVAVPKDFLKHVAAFFEAERPALASCLYRLSGATNLPMRFEAFIVNSDFWSQVLQSIALGPMKFALGAAMIITRAELAALGGFRSIVDYLADDFQLGNRATGKVALCTMVVECRSSPMSWRQVWTHQVRWARTIRVCQPTPFFFSILSNPTIWPLAWALAGAWLPALVMIVLRSLGGAALEFRFTRKFHASSIILAPFSDILRTAFWLLAFAGNRIYWGGRWFRVSPGGKLTPEATGG